jgi:hypothetical protein
VSSRPFCRVSPNWTRNDTTEFEATGAGQGYIQVDYTYRGVSASDSIPLTAAGVTINEPCVAVLHETEQFSVDTEPSGGTVTWSVVTGSDADGTFSPNPTTQTKTAFYPTDAGLGTLAVQYETDTKTYSDTADLVVLAVSVAPSAAVMDTGETQVFTASPVPDPEDLPGATLAWGLDWGGKKAPAILDTWGGDTAVVTAQDPGEGELKVEYEYGGKTASDTAFVAVPGIEVMPPLIDIGVGDTVPVEAKTYPSTDAGTVQWSVYGVGGEFESATARSTLFTGTGPGTGHVQCTFYSQGYGTHSDTIPTTVRQVTLDNDYTLAVGETVEMQCATQPDVELEPGVVSWSVDYDGEGFGGGIFNPAAAPCETTIFTATSGGSNILRVTYSGLGGQGDDDDTGELTCVSVEIADGGPVGESVPAAIVYGDSFTVTAMVLPPFDEEANSTLSWSLFDEEGNDAGGNFDPASSSDCNTTLFTADAGTGPFRIEASYTYDGATAYDTKPIAIIGDLTVVPDGAWVLVGGSEHYEAWNVTGPYDDSLITWSIEEGGSRVDLDTETGIVGGVEAGTFVVKAEVTGLGESDTATGWVVDLDGDLVGGFGFGLALLDKNPVEEMEEDHYFVAYSKIGWSYPKWGIFLFEDNPLPGDAHYELKNGKLFNAECYRDYDWVAKLLNWLFILAGKPDPHYTYQHLFQWIVQGYGLDQQKVDDGLYWLTEKYTDTGTRTEVLRVVRSGAMGAWRTDQGGPQGGGPGLALEEPKDVTGRAMKRIPLGRSAELGPDDIGKVYVPTRWGGLLGFDGDVRLYYYGAAEPSRQALLDILADRKQPVIPGLVHEYLVPVDGHGWYCARPSGAGQLDTTFLQECRVTPRPWNFYWWCDVPSALNLYEELGEYDYAPLAKYDRIFGTEARAIEENVDQGTDEWSGHCLGGAIASAVLKQPEPSRLALSQGITRDDLEGLWSELGDNGRHEGGIGMFGCPAVIPKPKQEKPDDEADGFVRMAQFTLESYLYGLPNGDGADPRDRRGRSLVANLRSTEKDPRAVWNHAVYDYFAVFQEAASPGSETEAQERLVNVLVELGANRCDHLPPTDGQDDREVRYAYTVRYSAAGLPEKSDDNDWLYVARDAVYAPSNIVAIKGQVIWESREPALQAVLLEKNVRQLDAANATRGAVEVPQP